jgi:signal peptidase I
MIYLLIPAAIIAGFAFEALLLHVTTKIFKVNGANYKTALIISVIQWISVLVIGLILGIILSIFGFENFSTIIGIVIGFVIFHKLLQKYYLTSLKKNIAIYVVLTIITVIASLAIIIPVRSFVIMPFYVQGTAMELTYKDGDYLLINRFSKDYQRGDVIIFRYPKNPQQFFIKRIIALPGEKIQLKDGSVYIYDKQNPNGYKLSESYLVPDMQTIGIDENIVELASNEYYVLGDNRKASLDSRSFGAVEDSYFIGEVWFKAGEK